MAFNYANIDQQALENMMPFFNTLANGAPITPQVNFMNHLVAALNNATTTHSSSALHNTLTTAGIGSVKSQNASKTTKCSPEPPPPPRLNSPSLTRNHIKPNQGTAPMDIENDIENDIPTIIASSTALNNEVTPKITSEKIPFNITDSNLYLNSLMASQMCTNPGFMFFPTNGTTGTPAANSLIDPTAMMAAMQQMQQYGTYGNSTLTDLVSNMDNSKIDQGSAAENIKSTSVAIKEVIKTKSCMLLPPNRDGPPPTMRDRPPGCRTVFVGGLPESITEEIVREIFESCGEILTLRMSKKNFCHIRFRQEESIDRAIHLSGYRVRINNTIEHTGRLHVDFAQARDDQYDYECKQRQLQREQRHRDRMCFVRLRSQSPPPIPHYSDHEASLVADSLRNNETFVKAVQTITIWLERGDCTKRNSNMFYSMIQSTHAHVRRLTSDKQQLKEELRKARESFRKEMLTMSAQFTQIEKVFNAASHKKVWDHFTKAQRKNIDQWKKLATELRSIQIDDDEMEMSDEDRDCQWSSHSKRKRYDSDNLKEENDSLRHQLEAMRNEMNLERTDLKCNSDFREKQMKVLQETIRNMQTQLLQTKMREQKDSKTIEHLEKRLKEAGVKQLLLKTKIREINEKLKVREANAPVVSETTEKQDVKEEVVQSLVKKENDSPIINVDVDKNDNEIKLIEENNEVKEIQDPSELKVEEVTTNGEKPLNHVEEEKPERLLPLKEVEPVSLALEEAKLIALTTAYLLIQPSGCSTQSICSYIKNITKDSQLQEKHLNLVLQKYHNLYTTNSHLDETMDSKDHELVVWKFCALMMQPNL